MTLLVLLILVLVFEPDDPSLSLGDELAGFLVSVVAAGATAAFVPIALDATDN